MLDAANPPGGDTRALMTRQAAAADIVLLNKTDIASRAQIAAAETMLAGCAPSARVIRTVDCAVTPSVLLGPLGPDDRRASGPEPEAPAHAGDGFATLSLEAADPVDRDRLERLLDTLPCPVLRIKGLLRFADDPGGVRVLHQVAARRRISAQAVESGNSRIVLIGTRRAMNPEALARHFESVGLGPVGAAP